jgi:hypothetical protein
MAAPRSGVGSSRRPPWAHTCRWVALAAGVLHGLPNACSHCDAGGAILAPASPRGFPSERQTIRLSQCRVKYPSCRQPPACVLLPHRSTPSARPRRDHSTFRKPWLPHTGAQLLRAGRERAWPGLSRVFECDSRLAAVHPLHRLLKVKLARPEPTKQRGEPACDVRRRADHHQPGLHAPD